MIIKYFSIKRCVSGFEEYESIPDQDDVYDDADILNECHEVYKLGSEELPDWANDIRGKIHNEPSQVFVERSNDGRISYFGFDKVES